MEKTLADLAVGDSGVVCGYAGEFGHYRRRLLSMGLVINTPFQVIRVAPMGDPVEIRLRDYRLSLRRDEARALKVA